MLGEEETQEHSSHRDVAGLTSSTEPPRSDSLAPVEWIRQVKPGDAPLVYSHLKPARLGLRLSWKDRDLLALADGRPTVFHAEDQAREDGRSSNIRT